VHLPAAATIVVPLLDQVDAWLEQCVRSALAQTVPCDVIVVRAPRTRPSNLALLAALGRAHPALRVVPEPSPGGFAAAINHGIALATTERVGLLLSDDWLDPDAVALALAHDADIVSTGHTEWTAEGDTPLLATSRARRVDEFARLGTLESQARYLSHFFLFRRAALLAVGGADESLGDHPGIDDFDLVWTLLEDGAKVAIVEERLYNYRDHDGERLTLRDREEALATLNRIFDKHGLHGPERERVLASHARWLGRPVHVADAEHKRRA
jgi:GT2 family glycosyltransferase